MKFLEYCVYCIWSLTISVIATNGGFRKLNKPNSPVQDTFIGQKSTKATRFRFDFVKPQHCITDGKCNQTPFTVLQDITKVHVFYNYWNLVIFIPMFRYYLNSEIWFYSLLSIFKPLCRVGYLSPGMDGQMICLVSMVFPSKSFY